MQSYVDYNIVKYVILYLYFANTRRDMSDQAGDAQEPTSAVITSKCFIIELYLPDVTVL